MSQSIAIVIWIENRDPFNLSEFKPGNPTLMKRNTFSVHVLELSIYPRDTRMRKAKIRTITYTVMVAYFI